MLSLVLYEELEREYEYKRTTGKLLLEVRFISLFNNTFLSELWYKKELVFARSLLTFWKVMVDQTHIAHIYKSSMLTNKPKFAKKCSLSAHKKDGLLCLNTEQYEDIRLKLKR